MFCYKREAPIYGAAALARCEEERVIKAAKLHEYYTCPAAAKARLAG